MDACTVETGLLKKKPCGEKAVSKCGNCEQPLCSKHAVGRMSAGKKTFLCPDCAKAWKDMGEAPAAPAVAKPAAAPKAAAAQPGPVAKPAAAKPAAKPAAPAAAAAKPKEAPKEEKKLDDDAPLEFTPSKKPEEKK